MTPGVAIVAALLALLVVGYVTRRGTCRHAAAGTRRLGGDVHAGLWEVCRCGAARMCGDRRWRRGTLERLSRTI